SDAFVTKLDPTGSALVYSTYLGGSDSDWGYGIAVDADRDAFVTGTTFSGNFPTAARAFQPTLSGSSDAFVTKLDPTGSALVYSTHLGGSGGGWQGIRDVGDPFHRLPDSSGSLPVHPGGLRGIR